MLSDSTLQRTNAKLSTYFIQLSICFLLLVKKCIYICILPLFANAFTSVHFDLINMYSTANETRKF